MCHDTRERPPTSDDSLLWPDLSFAQHSWPFSSSLHTVFPRCVDGQSALWAGGKEFGPATEGSLGDLPPYMDGTQLCLLKLGMWNCLMNLWSQYQEISKHTFVYIVNVGLCVFLSDWLAVGLGGTKTSVNTSYFASGYQLQIAFWLGVRPHVPFSSVLKPVWLVPILVLFMLQQPLWVHTWITPIVSENHQAPEVIRHCWLL